MGMRNAPFAMAQFELMQGPRRHRLLDQRASPIRFHVDFFVIICAMAAQFLTFYVVVAFFVICAFGSNSDLREGI
jgi:hypothetical protein